MYSSVFRLPGGTHVVERLDYIIKTAQSKMRFGGILAKPALCLVLDLWWLIQSSTLEMASWPRRRKYIIHNSSASQTK